MTTFPPGPPSHRQVEPRAGGDERLARASRPSLDDEGTRRLMEGFYERMLRTEDPLAPADALREASVALRDGKDADGKARFAAPRYWAAFVPYERK